MAKFQVPTVGGIRKVIKPGAMVSNATTIAGLEGTTLTLAQLSQLLATLDKNTGGGNIGTGAEAAISVGPGLAGGGPLVGVVNIRLTAPLGALGIVEDGADGNDGPPGPPGKAGAAGATGGAGPPGPAVFFLADDGADGDLGPPGPPGPLGASGATGTTGSTGAQGPAGPALFFLADDGQDGDLGAQGVQGPIGPRGPQGVGMMPEDANYDDQGYFVPFYSPEVFRVKELIVGSGTDAGVFGNAFGVGGIKQAIFQWFTDNNLYVSAPASGTPTGGQILLRVNVGGTPTTALTLTTGTSGIFAGNVSAKGATPAVTAGQTDIGTTTTATVITTAGGIALPALASTFWVTNVNGVKYGIPCFAL